VALASDVIANGASLKMNVGLHRWGDPIAAHEYHCRFPASIGLLSSRRNENLGTGLQVGFVTGHQVDNGRIRRHDDRLFAIIVLQR
jgi:hypothetical protein